MTSTPAPVPTRQPADRLPVVIQGGMGVGVSSWQLASAVAARGQLGVVSGTALDSVLARRLQDGDLDGTCRAALAEFPLPDVAERVLAKWFRPGGRDGEPYLAAPRLALRTSQAGNELSVCGNFVEVWLAKRGHEGLVGINYLEKIQMATPAAAYGAMLAGVDYVLMGAGIPREIPALLDALARNEPGGVHVDVIGGEPQWLQFDPSSLGADLPQVARPTFLAIVSADVMASYLAREAATRPDGFVVEGPSAGGHNAPPRGKMQLDETGQPVYGPRDDANLAKLAAVGLPFWLAGGYGEPERVRQALDAGAAGVQVGTLFAMSQESGLVPSLRRQLLTKLRDGSLVVRTEASASPTGFPFKLAMIEGTLAVPEVYEQRPRLCDLGYLRMPYARANGAVGYRCPAEPVDVFVRKGGTEEGAAGAQCLCNGLMADVGRGQERKDGYSEVPLITLGADLVGARRLDAELNGRQTRPDGWGAAEALEWLLRDVDADEDPALVADEPAAVR